MTYQKSDINHGTHRGPRSQPWISVEDLAFMYPPQHYPEIIREAGFRFDALDFFNLYGGRIPLKNRTFKALTRGKFEESLKVQEITAPATAGADITVTPMAEELDNGGNSQVRLKFTFMIPVGDSFEAYYIHDGSDAAGWQASPLNEEAYFADNIPEGSEIMIGHSLMTTGDDEVSGLRSRLYEWEYKTQISRERLGAEGGMVAQEEYEDIFMNDQNIGRVATGKFGRWLRDVEKRLRKQKESGIWMGQENTNNVVTENFVHGGNTAVLGSQGLRKTLEARGARLYYGDSISIDHLYDVKDHFIHAELGSNMGVLLCDSWLMRGLEEAGVEWLDTHGGGHDYKRVLRNVFGVDTAVDEMLNISFRMAYVNGILTSFIELGSLSNPATFGASSLEGMRGQGIYVPVETGMINLDGEDKELQNLTLGHLNNLGEDRTYVLGIINGMTGLDYTVTDSVDGINAHMLTEYSNIIINPEQMILFGKGTPPPVGE